MSEKQEKQEPVTRTDVAGAIRGLASFPWDELLATQRAILEELRDSGKEREKIVEAVWATETASESHASAVAGESTAKIVKELQEVKELLDGMKEIQGGMAKAVSGYAMSANRLELFLEAIMSGVHDTRRGLGSWGLVVSVLLFVGASDEILYLLGRLGRMF